jgi:hypothetical protein
MCHNKRFILCRLPIARPLLKLHALLFLLSCDGIKVLTFMINLEVWNRMLLHIDPHIGILVGKTFSRTIFI